MYSEQFSKEDIKLVLINISSK